MSATPLTRFAPAPTGWLHLGHALNALYVWDAARASGGGVLLRIEDHDRSRCRPEFEAGILDDLDWLGFAPDVYPTREFRAGPCAGRQSECGPAYAEAAAILIAKGLVYACDCSRRTVAGAVGERAADGAGGEMRYSGRCRDRGLALDAGRGWRVRMEPGVETFDDRAVGRQVQDPSAQCGDVLIRDRHGQWTYQFAAVVDDWRQSIDLVVRGTDLLASTGRQIRLARLLGRERPPVFLHHPLIVKSNGQKLSKADGDTGIRDLRARGLASREVLALAAAHADR